MSDQINQRWRKPSTPLAVNDDMTYATAELGRPTFEHTERWSPEEIDRRRHGYVCLKCWEPHEKPFPDKCALCGYQMRERQLSDFQEMFKGLERDPKAVSIEKGLARVDENHEKNFHVTKSGIVVPRTF